MDTAKKPEIKLNKSGRIRFTAGFFVCAILWMTGLAIVSAVLLPQHLRDIAGEAASTTIFGYVNAATAIASLVANLLFGNLSDRTRSRFGRRTPWIFWGAILAGVTLFLIGVVDNAWLIGIIYCVCMFGLNMMLAPVIATLSDRVPDDMRATMSAFNSAGTTGWFFIRDADRGQVHYDPDSRLCSRRHLDGPGGDRHDRCLATGKIL